ncbi:hypothetical protein N1851_027287 [Merluccius polli]|uniref:Integrase zinc-binding domain-containing protein n=1 Tax=Merluccius polli TaxID=89951 RepID=A0AA47NUE7_MERPO|nr:hypothetical protein N1851_027287 [Merluccius polli]
MFSTRRLLQFLWRDLKQDSPPSVYEWQVLPFGTTCSSCCATFALQKHVLDHNQPEEDVRVALQGSFYVDNCLQSLTSREAAMALEDKLQHLLAEGGFDLRQWASNDSSIINHQPTNVEVSFIASRSRVAPKKQRSIPRPRLTEIQELTGSATWRYVPSGDNPADDITRGLALQDLCDGSRWTHGRAFLKLPPDEWSEQPCSPHNEPESEMRRPAVAVLTTSVSSLPDPQQHQTLYDYLEATARQLHGAADPATPMTADAYAVAELEALQQAQRDSFPEITKLKASKPVAKSSRLMSLAPERDEATGLARVGGRLCRSSDLTSDAIHLIVLNPQHPLTRLIIQDYDDKLHHPGPERVFAGIRRRYWVLRGREAVRRYQRKCAECRKWRGRPDPPKMADLPPTRQRIFKPAFYSTGVDCFGPYIIRVGRRNEKRWGILFKCMTTRAVHVDLLTSIDTDVFLMTLRHFIARRGRPHELLCDQGTHFRGGERELQKFFTALQPELQDSQPTDQIRLQPSGITTFQRLLGERDSLLFNYF